MTTDSLSMRPPLISYIGLLGRGLVMLIILALGILALVINYWFGVAFIFSSLLILILFGFKGFQGRNLLLLLYSFALVAVIVSSVAYTFLVSSQALAQGNIDQSALVTSILIGAVVSFVAIVPFFLVVTVAALGILKWHKYQGVTFLQAYRYLLSLALGLRYLWIIIDRGEIYGDEGDIKRLITFGGPGWLRVYPGQIVILHHWGKITRVVGPGSVMLEHHEKIQTILPLGTKGGVNTIENVLTKDRVPLTLKVLHAVRLEPAKATQQRLGTMKDDPIVGDDYDQCYESIARLASQKAPDMWGTVKNVIANNMKDVIMTCEFEELFGMTQDDSEDLVVRADQRKLADIEKTVLEKAKGYGLKKGVMLLAVDINEIQYPEEIRDKINKEATAHLDAKMRQHEAQARELTAQFEAQAMKIEAEAFSRAKATEAESEETGAQYKARAMIHLAKAEAEAETIKEEAKMKARTEYFRQVIEVLRQQGQSDDTIRAVLENLASSSALEDQLKRAINLTVQRQVVNSVPRSKTNSG